MMIGEFRRQRLIEAMDRVREAEQDVRDKLDDVTVVDHAFASQLEALESRLKDAARDLEQLRREFRDEG